jgi:hypothetical protein
MVCAWGGACVAGALPVPGEGGAVGPGAGAGSRRKFTSSRQTFAGCPDLTGAAGVCAVAPKEANAVVASTVKTTALIAHLSIHQSGARRKVSAAASEAGGQERLRGSAGYSAGAAIGITPAETAPTRRRSR